MPETSFSSSHYRTSIFTCGEHLGATSYPSNSDSGSSLYHPEFDERRELRHISRERLGEIWKDAHMRDEQQHGERRTTATNITATTTTLASSLSSNAVEHATPSPARPDPTCNLSPPIRKVAAGFTSTFLLSSDGQISILSNTHSDFTPLPLSHLNTKYYFSDMSVGYRHAVLVGEDRADRERRLREREMERRMREATENRNREMQENAASAELEQQSDRVPSPSARTLKKRPSQRLIRANSGRISSNSTSSQRKSPPNRSVTRSSSKNQLKKVPSSKNTSHRSISSLVHTDAVKRLFKSNTSRHRSSGTQLIKMKRKKRIEAKKVIVGLGSNEFHQLGFKLSRIQQSNAFELSLPPLHEKLSLVEVACGYYHTLFLMSDHSIWSCGSPILEVYSEAQLSGYLKFEVYSPDTDELLPIRTIAAGAAHNLAVALNGSVYSWGSNSCGQCALGHTHDAPIPTKIVALQNHHIVKAAAGYYHSVFLSSHGHVFTCGDCSYGRIGRRSNGSSPLRVILNGPARSIAAGGYHSIVTLRNGSAYSMGHSGFGQCGIYPGQCTPCYFEPQKVSAPHHSTFVTHCSAGGYHSVLLHEETPMLRGKMRFFAGLIQSLNVAAATRGESCFVDTWIRCDK